MKKLLTALAIAPLFLTQPALAEVGPWYGHSSYYEQHRLDNIEARKVQQREALERGVARGRITPEERARLTVELVRIIQTERIYKADGRFTAEERARLSHLQDIAERHIRQATNDRDGRRYHY